MKITTKSTKEHIKKLAVEAPNSFIFDGAGDTSPKGRYLYALGKGENGKYRTTPAQFAEAIDGDFKKAYDLNTKTMQALSDSLRQIRKTLHAIDDRKFNAIKAPVEPSVANEAATTPAPAPSASGESLVTNKAFESAFLGLAGHANTTAGQLSELAGVVGVKFKEVDGKLEEQDGRIVANQQQITKSDMKHNKLQGEFDEEKSKSARKFEEIWDVITKEKSSGVKPKASGIKPKALCVSFEGVLGQDAEVRDGAVPEEPVDAPPSSVPGTPRTVSREDAEVRDGAVPEEPVDAPPSSVPGTPRTVSPEDAEVRAGAAPEEPVDAPTSSLLSDTPTKKTYQSALERGMPRTLSLEEVEEEVDDGSLDTHTSMRSPVAGSLMTISCGLLLVGLALNGPRLDAVLVLPERLEPLTALASGLVEGASELLRSPFTFDDTVVNASRSDAQHDEVICDASAYLVAGPCIFGGQTMLH